MTNRYFTLLVKWDDKWSIEYGSYDRKDITDEKISLHDGHQRVPYTKMKVIETGDTQVDIDAQVDLLNNIPFQPKSETVDI